MFGRLPLTRARMQTTLDRRRRAATPDRIPGTAAQQPFFERARRGAHHPRSQIAAGAYDADPDRRALAEATLAQGTAAVRRTSSPCWAIPPPPSPFIPTGSSEAGTALDARLDALQTTLESSLGVGGFAARPSLPAAACDRRTTSSAFIGDPFGPIGVQPGDEEIDFPG